MGFSLKNETENLSEGYEINKPLLAHWYIEGKCPRTRDGPQNISFALEASLLGQMFIFRTISNPRTLSFDIPAARRGLFTKYPSSREKQNGGRLVIELSEDKNWLYSETKHQKD